MQRSLCWFLHNNNGFNNLQNLKQLDRSGQTNGRPGTRVALFERVSVEIYHRYARHPKIMLMSVTYVNNMTTTNH